MVDKKYDAQRRLRQKWVGLQLEKLTKEKEKVEGQGTLRESQGSWEPFDIIVDREGGPSRPVAIKATLNYTMACIHFHRQGHEAIPGAPWVAYNGMTRRWEYLYLKKTCKDWFSEAYKITTKAYEVCDSQEGVGQEAEVNESDTTPIKTSRPGSTGQIATTPSESKAGPGTKAAPKGQASPKGQAAAKGQCGC